MAIFPGPSLPVTRRIHVGLTVFFLVLAVVNVVAGSTFGALSSLGLAVLSIVLVAVDTAILHRRATGAGPADG